MSRVKEKAEISKKQKEIFELLQSSEDVLIQKGLTELRKSGNDLYVPALLQLFVETDNELLFSGLKDVFFEIKSQTAADHILNFVSSNTNHHHSALLVSIIWEAGLDASDQLSKLVTIAIQSDYLTCLECLTVVENFETEFTEEEIIKCCTDLKEAVLVKDEKQELLSALHHTIQSFMIG